MAGNKHTGPPWGDIDSSVGQSFAPPGMPGMPGPIFPQPAMMVPYPPFPQYTMPPAGEETTLQEEPTSSSYQSVGNLIRLGVEVISASLSGGLQIMQGLTGQGTAFIDSQWCDDHHYYQHECSCLGYSHHSYGYHGCSHHGQSHHGYHGYSDCCSHEVYRCDCYPCATYHGCNPSVHNCC